MSLAPDLSQLRRRWLLLGAVIALVAGLAGTVPQRWALNSVQTGADRAPQRRDGSYAKDEAPTEAQEAAPMPAFPSTATPTRARPPLATRSAAAHQAVPAGPRMTDRVAPSPSSDALQAAYEALLAGHDGRAAQLYEDSLRVHPQERDALLGLAFIAWRAGQSERALAYYQHVLRQDPQHASAHAGVLALERTMDINQAASRVRERADRQPESAVAAAALGKILVRQALLADAALAFERALRLQPDNAGCSYDLAVAQDRLHRYRQARVAYERAMGLSALGAASAAYGFSREAVRQRLRQLPAPAMDGPDAHACKHDGAAACAPTEVVER